MPSVRPSLAAALICLLAGASACRKQEEPPLRVKQRSEVTIAPGVTLKLGDIKTASGGDTAWVSVIANGSEVAKTEARAGEVISYRVAGDSRLRTIEVVRFENHLAHEDYAYFRVGR